VSEPCHFIAFDVLRLADEVFVEEPLSTRRGRLEELFAAIPPESPLALGMQTSDLDTAREWFNALAAVGVEGIVIKPAASRYLPGQRGWEKVKHYTSTEFIIGGITGTLKRPEQLQLGRYSSEDGEFRLYGRTVPLHTADAAKVAAAITPAGPDHPWPERLPGGWMTSKEIEYVRVEPTVVVEVRVDTASQAGRWRHGLRFLRLRPELRPEDVPTDLDTA
jgi:ATP-dependent DNA ligase